MEEMFPMSANGNLLFSAGPLLFFLRNSLEGDLDPAKKEAKSGELLRLKDISARVGQPLRPRSHLNFEDDLEKSIHTYILQNHYLDK